MIKLNSKAVVLKRIICVLIIIVALINVFFAGFNFVYIKTYVKGKSMYPTLNVNVSSNEVGDKIYINKFAKVNKNDIIVLNFKEEGSYIIKRLIAMEDDIVNIEEDEELEQYNLLVNNQIMYVKPYIFDVYGQKIEYTTYKSFISYVNENKDDESRIYQEDGVIKGVIIKEDEVYLLGDNWSVSKDSSIMGPYKKQDVIGKVDFIIPKGANTFKTILKQIF